MGSGHCCKLEGKKRYTEKHKAELTKYNHDYYLKNKKKINEQNIDRQRMIMQRWYEWRKANITGYLIREISWNNDKGEKNE
jgi:hypothetical protein